MEITFQLAVLIGVFLVAVYLAIRIHKLHKDD